MEGLRTYTALYLTLCNQLLHCCVLFL